MTCQLGIAAMRTVLLDGKRHIGKPGTAVIRAGIAAPVSDVVGAEGMGFTVFSGNGAGTVDDLDIAAKEIRVRHINRSGGAI